MRVNTGTDPGALADWDFSPDEPMPIGGAEAEIRDNELRTIGFAGPVTGTGNIVAYRGNEDDSIAIVVEDGEGWSISDNTISGYPKFGIRQKGARAVTWWAAPWSTTASTCPSRRALTRRSTPPTRSATRHPPTAESVSGSTGTRVAQSGPGPGRRQAATHSTSA